MCKDCFSELDRRQFTVPKRGILPLRCAIDFLPYRRAIIEHEEDRQRRVANICAIFRLLIQRGADVNAVTKEDDTPLHFTASRCAAEVVRVLLDSGADVKAINSREQNVLHAVFIDISPLDRGNIVDCLEALLTAGVDVHARDESGQTSIYDVSGERVRSPDI